MNEITVIETNKLKEIISSTIKSELKELIQVKQEPQPKHESILTRKELADLLHISLVTIHNRMKDGTLIYHKLGRRVFFKVSEIMSSLGG